MATMSKVSKRILVRINRTDPFSPCGWTTETQELFFEEGTVFPGQAIEGRMYSRRHKGGTAGRIPEDGSIEQIIIFKKEITT